MRQEQERIMIIDTDNMVSITEANQNFSKIARMVDENGSVVILKNNKPKYLLIDFPQNENKETLSDDIVSEISRSLMVKNREAYKVLAK